MTEIKDKLVDVNGLRHIYERLSSWISDIHTECNDRLNNKLGKATNVPVPGQILIADDNFSWSWKNMPAHISESDVRRIANEQIAKIKGTVKDTFVHVDDAFPSSLLGIEVEGACRQDGTPSPDNPVPIEVVENPVVRVTGRNLLDIHEGMPESDCNKGFESDKKRIIKPGTYVVGLTANNYLDDTHVINVQIGNGAVSFHSDAGGYGVGFGVSLVPGVTYEFNAKAKGNFVFRFAFYDADGTWLSQVTTNTPTVPINAVYSVLIITTKDGLSDVALRDIYGAATQITYEPYVGTTIPFTLPAEHPYLAKLPEGTADEIVVDKDGNVELVARVGIDKDVREVGNFLQGQHYSLNTNIRPFASLHENYDAIVLCSALPSRKTSSTNEGIYRTWNDVYVRDTSGRTKEEIQAEVDKNAPLTVVAKIPETRYKLGKIEMPKAQDSIVNVWTDAEVTPRTSIEYIRDMNIVVENLESAIASITQG